MILGACMECYDYFICAQTECISHTDDRHCWQILTTKCAIEIANKTNDKSISLGYEQYDNKTLCDNCPYREEIFNPLKNNKSNLSTT